jgi:outer membrane protein assembly factor BamB
VIFDGNVFVGASDDTFRCLRLTDGAPVWTFGEVQGFVECRAFVDAQQVVFGTWENRLYSLDTRTGALQWTWKCAKPSRMYSPAATWPVKSAGKIFISVPDRCLYVLDARTGEQLACREQCAREAIGLSEDGRTVYTKSMWHRLFAWNAADASAKWAVETTAGYEISPTALVEKDGVVLMPTDKGNLLAFSASDGSLLWKHKLSIAMVNPLLVWTDQGHLLILASTMDGTITLLTIS